MCGNGVAGEEDERRGEKWRGRKCWLPQSLVCCFFNFEGNLLKPGNPYCGQLTDLPTDRPTDQQTDQPIDQPNHRLTNGLTDQPTNQLTNQMTDRPNNQPTNHCIIIVVASWMDVKKNNFDATIALRWSGGQLVVGVSTSLSSPTVDRRAGTC
jgi:hypothetical protein